MRIARIIEQTRAEGPGARFCIWVQGCGHCCRGCFAENLWDYNGGEEVSVKSIITRIERVKDKICGITLLGGEPFDKSNDLSQIAEYAHSIGKSVICFTGYGYDELNDENHLKLLSFTDILIDGEYIEEKRDFSRPLVGSSNQNIIFLTDRISKEEFYSYKNRFELRTDSDGKIIVNGMGNVERLSEKLKGML